MNNLKNTKLPSIKNSIGMELVEVPEGKFQMGCSNSDPNCDDDELPPKKINIEKSFYLGKFEVTKGEFSRFISETSYQTDAERFGFSNTWRSCQGIKQNDYHPVICVSWNDTKQFLKWLSQKETRVYRLPSEAEWEYAAKANFFTRYYWGMDIDESYVWYNKNSERTTHRVGSKKPNTWGFFDMSGNVWEWCEDEYDKEYFKKQEAKNPMYLKSENNKVLRGGSWFDSYLFLRLSARAYAGKDVRESHYGFRVVLEK